MAGNSNRSVFTPTIFYRRPSEALHWLERAFGFDTRLLVTDSDGNLAHSAVSFGNGEVGIAGEWFGEQLGAARMLSPQAVDGACTQFIWVTLESGIDDHCDHARKAGAAITQEPTDQFYGDRTYRALDPEGHVWCFRQRVKTVSNTEMEAATGLKIEIGGND
ncbi:MAG TPA: VOC family protein [Woeseiaceae bacterium]|nr:VOC family protein [Woeseiaceae bacterium]